MKRKEKSGEENKEDYNIGTHKGDTYGGVKGERERPIGIKLWRIIVEKKELQISKIVSTYF